MKASRHYNLASDGFCGAYYAAKTPSDFGFIVIVGDEADDFLNTAFAGYFTKVQNIHVLTVALKEKGAKEAGLNLWPLERVERALQALKDLGMKQVGILGMSMQASLVLNAAARIPDFSLVLAFTPNDFVPWGFFQGKIGGDRHGEWPSGNSAFTWRGKPLAFQPAGLEKDPYWNLYLSEKKTYKEMHTVTIFEKSEELHPITDDAKIPVEDIGGKLVLIGARDDVMWNTEKYILRLKERMETAGKAENLTTLLYPYGTHLLVPERLLKGAIPLFGDLISRMFTSGKEHPKECKQARMDLDFTLSELLENWKTGKI